MQARGKPWKKEHANRTKKKLHATQELSQPDLPSCPCFADRVLINLHVFNAVIIIFPAKTIVQFLCHLILREGHFKQSPFFSLSTLSCL